MTPSEMQPGLPVPLKGRWYDVQGRAMFARLSTTPTHDLEGETANGALSGDVVMVHGLGISSSYMVPAGEMLAANFRVYAPDLPGFGRSDKPAHVLNIAEMAEAIKEWLDVAGIGRATFIGNSIGCQVLAHFAVHHPDRVAHMIFIGPTFDHVSRFVVPVFIRAFLDSVREPSSLAKLVRRDYLTAGPIRLVKTLFYALSDHVEPLLPQIMAPVLVVRGQHDAICPPHWAKEVTRLLPEANLRSIKGASHAVHYSDPHTFVRLALPFLSGQTLL